MTGSNIEKFPKLQRKKPNKSTLISSRQNSGKSKFSSNFEFYKQNIAIFPSKFSKLSLPKKQSKINIFPFKSKRTNQVYSPKKTSFKIAFRKKNLIRLEKFLFFQTKFQDKVNYKHFVIAFLFLKGGRRSFKRAANSIFLVCLFVTSYKGPELASNIDCSLAKVASSNWLACVCVSSPVLLCLVIGIDFCFHSFGEARAARETWCSCLKGPTRVWLIKFAFLSLLLLLRRRLLLVE